MRFSVIASIALAALALPVGAAYAACTRPDTKLTIPDGSAASEAEMKAASAALVKLDQDMGEYLRCIKGEASQSTVGKDEPTREKILREYVDSHNSMTDAVAGLATCYNANVEVYQKTNGGKGGAGGKPADCSAQMAAAKNRSDASFAPGGTPTPSNIVKEADGNSFELPGGRWSYTLVRDDTPRKCGEKTDKPCVKRTVFVTNGSEQELECKAYIKYDGTDAQGRGQTDAQAVVSKQTLRAVVWSLAPQGVNASTFEAVCTPRAPMPPLETKANCKYEVVKPVNISDFYPEESRQLDEQGPVVVEFTVPGKAASPTNVKVVASSLSPRLDDGAIKAVGAMIMSSACKNERYRLRLNFQLEE